MMYLNKFFKLFFFLVSFTSLTFSGCFEYVYQYTEPNLNIFCEDFYSQDKHFQIVYINKAPTLLFLENSSEPLTEEKKINSLLESSIILKSNFSSTLNLAKKAVEELTLEKNAAEEKCLQYTGISSYECYDKDSCLLAAFSVPQASIAVNSPGFIDAMIDFNKRRKSLTQKISDLSTLLSSPIEPNAKKIEEILISFNNVEKEVRDYNKSPLMLNENDSECISNPNSCFEYCPKIFISSSWEESKAKLQNSKQILQNLDNTKNLAKEISQNSLNWLNFFNKRTTMWDEVKSELINLLNSINNSINSKRWKDRNLEAMLNESILEFEAIKLNIKNGEFFVALDRSIKLRSSLQDLSAKAKSYEQKLNEIDSKLKVVQISLDELKSSAEYEVFNEKFKELKNLSSSTVEVENLEKLSMEVYNLEKDILSAVALKKLNIKEEEIESNISQAQNTTPKTSSTPYTPSFSCPFSIGLLGLILLLLFNFRAENKTKGL
ncbi:MAG: hypothetical protein QXV64_01695 [Candidatus Anstonellaceae archaeon]